MGACQSDASADEGLLALEAVCFPAGEEWADPTEAIENRELFGITAEEVRGAVGPRLKQATLTGFVKCPPVSPHISTAEMGYYAVPDPTGPIETVGQLIDKRKDLAYINAHEFKGILRSMRPEDVLEAKRMRRMAVNRRCATESKIRAGKRCREHAEHLLTVINRCEEVINNLRVLVDPGSTAANYLAGIAPANTEGLTDDLNVVYSAV